ncbi:MAG TPA: hypothetical protein VMV73_02700, partial [Candidatus Dormibacteraeota bacterium]|nr:hypothetical protein [Candidatus Dormibacteraeota bacterium]
NSRSVSVYPFAEVRRSFTYIAYFYWLAVILAGFDAVIAPVLSWLQRSRLLARALVTLRGAILRYRIADALRVVALPIVAVPIAVALWFLCSQAAYYGRPSPGQVILHDAHRFERLLGLAPASTTGAWIHLAPTFAAIEYLERHTAPGDWIYSNIISTSNDFDYLADGRYSLLEGTSMYQMYDTIKKSVRHIQRFRRFALTADPSLVQKWRPKYALLYRANQCNVLDCYGTQVYPVAFDRFKNNRAFVRVFANRLYVIYRITGVPGSAASATLTKLMRRCSSHNSPPVARIAACTKELRLVGKLDPNGFYYRARAEAALGQENAAMRDFTTDIERDPTNYGVYLAEARSLMNAGNVLEARADIHLAEGNGVYPSTLPGP